MAANPVTVPVTQAPATTALPPTKAAIPTKPPPPQPPPTTATTTTIMTTKSSSASQVTNENANVCVLASTLSATFVILFVLIAFGVLYFLWKRKKGKAAMSSDRTSTEVPKLPLKTGSSTDASHNQAFQSDVEYNVPPHREAPLPCKKHGKRDNQPISPYHKPLDTQDDYSVPPPARPETSIKPPLPPNLARKMQQNNENGAATNHDETGNAYYLDMECIKDGLYQNMDTSQDNIYINN